MLISLKSPGTYIQEKDVITNLYPYISLYGNNAVFLISPSGIKRHKADILSGLSAENFTCSFNEIQGECSRLQIDNIVSKLSDNIPDMIIGVGGGKILDITKAVSDNLNTTCIVIPTVASTDAPCSALSVLYTPEGVFDKYLHTKKCPDAVIVDPRIIADAPYKYLAYGMGDALATYFEARAVKRSGSVNQLSTMPTSAAYALAKGCYETLLEYGQDAYESAKRHEVSMALEKITEANIYLSGVGFESGGVAAAHGFQKGVTVIPVLHSHAHGEIVAFNTIVQLCLEHAPAAELETVIRFCKSIDLPTCFLELSDAPISKEDWLRAAEFACRPGMTVHKMPFDVTPGMLVDAVYAADEYSRSMKF